MYVFFCFVLGFFAWLDPSLPAPIPRLRVSPLPVRVCQFFMTTSCFLNRGACPVRLMVWVSCGWRSGSLYRARPRQGLHHREAQGMPYRTRDRGMKALEGWGGKRRDEARSKPPLGAKR